MRKNSIKNTRINQEVLKELSVIISREVKDPRIDPLATVTNVIVAPDLKTAKEYLATEQYLWNAGQFVWKVSTILKNLKTFMPYSYTHLEKIMATIGTEFYEETLQAEFGKMEALSIDYGVMERAKDIYVFPGNFGWDDVGSWLAVARLQKEDENGNILSGDIISIDSRNSIVQADNKLIAVVGLDNIVVVDTEDALLICNKEDAGKIKDVMKKLEDAGRNELL